MEMAKKISSKIHCGDVFMLIFLFSLAQNTPTRATMQRQYRKFETNIPRKGVAQPQSQFPHSCVCERFIYAQDQSAYPAAGKCVDRFWEYIYTVNSSQIHACGNSDRGRAISFLGLHKWDFRCSAVCHCDKNDFLRNPGKLETQRNNPSVEPPHYK